MRDRDEVYTFPACFRDPEARAVLERLCAENGHTVALLEDLYQVVLKYTGSGRPDGINDEVGHVLDEHASRERAL